MKYHCYVKKKIFGTFLFENQQRKDMKYHCYVNKKKSSLYKCLNESHSVYGNKVIGGRPNIRIGCEYGICCRSSSLEPAMEMQLYLV